MSDFRKWTPEGEADAAGAIARAVGGRPGCRRAICMAAIVAVVAIVIALVAHLVLG